MSDDYGIQGLNGPEIIDDSLAQLRKRLQGDCSLRPQDSYSRGYSCKISYRFEMYGLDKEVVEGEIDLGEKQDDPEAEIEEGILEVTQEEDLGEVRDRIRAATGGEASGEAGGEETTVGAPAAIAAKRKYTRKLQLASPGVIGGAEEFKE